MTKGELERKLQGLVEQDSQVEDGPLKRPLISDDEQKRAYAHFEKGEQLFKQKHYEQASAEFRIAAGIYAGLEKQYGGLFREANEKHGISDEGLYELCRTFVMNQEAAILNSAEACS